MLRPMLKVGLFVWCCASAGMAQESLLIGPGDQIFVQVFDTPEMDQHPRVTDAGTVPLLFIGDIKVAGLIPGDAAHMIEATLKEQQYMQHPHVAVTIEDYGTQQVAVMGQVTNAGVYSITAPTSIITVLSMAGGLTDLADRHITIQRHGESGERVSYFISNTSDKALNESVLIYPGDTVLVPKAPVIYVIGDVGRPGGYPITTNDARLSALQAIALAGFTNKTALGNKARVIRKTASGTQEIPVQLSSIQNGSIPDLALREDDVLFVPFSWMKNVIISSSSIAATAGGAAVYAAH